MIKCILTGRLTKDATVNTVGGKQVINYAIATETGFKENKKTHFVDCSQWTDKVGVAAYLLKGSQVVVDGEPSIREYQRKDGTNGASFALRVNNVELLGGNPNRAAAPTQTIEASEITEPESDLPF